nr:hypothetical protein [Tanacetum cinerariifolium]
MNRDHSEELLKDLAKARKKKKKRRDLPKTPPGSPPHQPPPPLPPVGLSRASGSPGASRSSQVLPPPPPPLSTNQEGQSRGYTAPSTSKTAASAEYKAWTMTGTRLKLSVSSIPKDLQMDDDMAPDAQAQYVDDSITRHNVSKPLPLGGPPGQMWIEEECKYDIAAMYSISHWWFQRQGFYIDRHTSEGDQRDVRTYMQILSVFRIEVFSMYGYNYMKKIVLRTTDLNEHIIAERDFKYLYLSDFKDLYLLNIQGLLYHLPPKDKKILTTAVNLWTRHLVIRQRVEDFQIGIKS